MKFISDFFVGLSLPLRAAKLLLTNRRLLLWSLLPVLVALILYGTIFTAILYPAREQISGLVQGWLGSSTGTYSGALSRIAGWILSTILSVALILVMGLAFGSAVNIVSLPVNDFLAQAAELAISPPLSRPPTDGWKGEIRLFFIDLQKSVLSIIALLICLILAFIPIMNVFAVPLGWIFFASQYVSYPQTRRSIGAWQGFKWLFNHLGLSLGFGLLLALGFSVPFLGILIHPLGIIGGVIAFSFEQRSK